MALIALFVKIGTVVSSYWNPRGLSLGLGRLVGKDVKYSSSFLEIPVGLQASCRGDISTSKLSPL